MHLTVFQSGKGDCLLLSNAKGTARILVDGGMPDAYRAHVAPALGKVRQSKKSIDLVYVSHIDQDHIGGILKMLDDEVAWRVHDFQKASGNSKHKAPTVPRPPQVGKIWHNAFHEQLKKNAGSIEEALAAAAPVLSGADVVAMREAGLAQSELVTSIREAIQVSRRIGPKQLGIPLNPESGGKLMMFRKNQQPVKIGGMKITVLGPTEAHLKRLRADWNDWLSNNEKALKTIKDSARKEEERLGTSDLDRLLLALSLQAEAFGDPNKVTPPNLASLTLLVEEDGESILLTGDARGDQIIDGLKATGRLANGQPFQVDVLKVQHHGSENNIDRVFCDTVVAEDYVFCGNGQHENPDRRVVELIAKRRLAASGDFKFWFNSSEAIVEKEAAAGHMAEVETLVRTLAKGSKGRMQFRFLTSGSSLQVM
jgi:beta-lactamase superfamily II metal-dependent hydrolase